MTTVLDTTDHRTRQVRRTLWLGFALQLAVAAVPLIDLATFDSITEHVRAAYPDWSAEDVALDRDAITWSLTGIGVLGCVGWLVAVALAKRPNASRITVTALFAIGLMTSLTLLSMGGEGYDLVVPLAHGLLALLPLLAGLAAVVAVWRRR
ncbi:hypothetical protein SAMN05216298_1812 [Glycomyces sambucus]|uniref:Uncharacterized protein n=1 Tax=Glycomyces sambucus TaxID=380244 RepID=A0A1G9FIE6_9ACTN|nr:hypothetical protein [Glycomyces sambucus]SDK88112.1 hypothetical protein SAMN05216298_1812 [Glycomyces sambucus]